MFPPPRQRWVDDLALSGAELNGVQPAGAAGARRRRPGRAVAVVVGALVDLLPDCRLHVIGGCGHWTMIERTAEFLAVVEPFLAG